jgi:hypothetical protein
MENELILADDARCLKHNLVLWHTMSKFVVKRLVVLELSI